jgi:hypothetical protein
MFMALDPFAIRDGTVAEARRAFPAGSSDETQ